MPQYGILRFEKHKGNPARPMEAHHERQKEKYASNPDVDKSRSKYNFHIVQPQGRYYHEIQSRIEKAGCRTRRDSTRFVDTLITASPKFFKGRTSEDVRAYFERAANFISRRVGRNNIISAVVHMDEKTPHMHLIFVPLTKDNRLSAKEILGNRASLSKWQDDFFAYMVQKYPELERGESARETGRQHIPTRVFKQAVHLTKQAKQIEDILSSINPLNTGKKRDEVMALLSKWFPDMENFETLIRKYRRTLTYLKEENQDLAEKAIAANSGKMETELKIATLQSDIRQLRRFVDSIPDDMMRQIKQIRRERNRDERQR